MTFLKASLGSLVAAALIVAPVAAQAGATRAPSETAQSEDLAGSSFVLYLALAAAAAALIFFVLDEDSFDDVDDLPASP